MSTKASIRNTEKEDSYTHAKKKGGRQSIKKQERRVEAVRHSKCACCVVFSTVCRIPRTHVYTIYTTPDGYTLNKNKERISKQIALRALLRYPRGKRCDGDVPQQQGIYSCCSATTHRFNFAASIVCERVVASRRRGGISRTTNTKLDKDGW